jgi:nicotinamidase/pyrazinamidase
MVPYDATWALLVVDVQNDFADPKGSLSVRGGHEVVPLIDMEIVRASRTGAPVIYTQDWHPEHTPHFATDGGIWPPHCVQATWGAELHPGLRVEGPVVRKGADGSDAYSGFSTRHPETGVERDTELDELLRSRGVQRLAICGLATDYCVLETVLDARMLGYPVVVLRSMIRAVDLEPGDGERALSRMLDAGAELA